MVLNDSVLHHRHRAIAAAVRVGIALFRFAVGGPAGVADAALPGRSLCFKTSGEVAQLALGPQAGQLAPDRPLWRSQRSRNRGTPAGEGPPEAGVPLLGNPPGQRFRTYKKSPAEAGLSL